MQTPGQFVQALLGAGLVLTLSGCVGSPGQSDANSDFVTVASQPANVGDAKIAALAYHDSGAYDRDLALVAGQASRWIAGRAQAVARPALVLDVDETALSNWEVLTRDDFGRPVPGPCDPALDTHRAGWAAWDLLGRDPAIGPTLEVFRQARAANVTVFFITCRTSAESPTRRDGTQSGGGGVRRLREAVSGSGRRALRVGGRLQGAGPRRDRGCRLHRHREYGGPAIRPDRRPRGAEIPAARSVLPSAVSLRNRASMRRRSRGHFPANACAPSPPPRSTPVDPRGPGVAPGLGLPL